MKLRELYELIYDKDDYHIKYAFKFLEIYQGNDHLYDNCRRDIEHNGAEERYNHLTGEEELEDGIYIVEHGGHDGREVLLKYESIEDAMKYGNKWLDNPFVYSIHLVDTNTNKVVAIK